MANYKADITLNEKDSLTDMLTLEKTMLKVYATAWTESASRNFQSLIKKHVGETACDQQEVFLKMEEHGYYKVEPAPETSLSEERNKFAKVKGQLS